MNILEEHKPPLFEFITGISQLHYPVKSGKRCPPLTLWSRFPIFAPYCLISFPMPPFNIFNDAAQGIIAQESLSDSSTYDKIAKEIKDFYADNYPDAYFDVKIFPEKYHNIKGYFVYIDQERSCAMFWGYDDIEDELELDLDLFEENSEDDTYN